MNDDKACFADSARKVSRYLLLVTNNQCRSDDFFYTLLKLRVASTWRRSAAEDIVPTNLEWVSKLTPYGFYSALREQCVFAGSHGRSFTSHRTPI